MPRSCQTRSSLTSQLLHTFFTLDELNVFFASVSRASPFCGDSDLVRALVVPLSGQPVFKFANISPETVSLTIVSTTTLSHSAGPIGVSLFCIHSALPRLASLPASFFNASLTTGHFSSSWKHAFIRPLLNHGTPNSPSDTRPIANLCGISKVFEHVVHRQVTDIIAKNNLLNPYQSGYRSESSTQSALLCVCHDVRRAMDDGCVTLLVLFDFSKAFDTISYSKLLVKLRILGFGHSALRWFFSYLTGRSQAVVNDVGGCSGWLTTAAGVPQGSVFCPLLFSLFINDISSALRYTQYMIFADDTQIHLSCPPSQIISRINIITHDVGVIANYASENGLKLNLTKSKVLVMGSRAVVSRINLSSLPPIMVGGTRLPFVSVARNLDVVMSSDLSWRSHVMSISGKVQFTLYRLRFHRRALTRELRSALIVSLVFPIVDYCCLV